MKDKRNRHGAVGKSSSEQHFHKSAAITFIVEPYTKRNWVLQQAGRLAAIQNFQSWL